MMRTSSQLMAALFAVSCLAPLAPAHAQSEKTVVKAGRLIGPDEDLEDIRKGFQMLSDEIRDNPGASSPSGLWLRGEAATLIAIHDSQGFATALVALESFEQSVAMLKSERDLLVLARLEAFLHDRAQSHDSAKSNEEALAAFEAAQLYLRADDLRIQLDASKPVERARRYILAVSAALAADDVRAARKLFEELDAMGGFIEDLAIRVARKIEDQDSPHQSFLFMLDLQGRHPRHRKLLKAFTDLCLQNGWTREASEALEKSVPFYKDNYEDQMLVAGYYDALGKPEKALEYYEAALVHAPRGFDANYLYATLLIRISESDEDPERAATRRARARQSLLLVLESNPDSKDAKMALEGIEPSTETDDGAADPTP